MRVLTTQTQEATSAPVTQPIYLVEIDFSPKIRLSTNGDVTWGGHEWSGGQIVVVSNLGSDGGGATRATLQIGNLDGAIGTLTLGQGINDKAVRIFAGDKSALGPDDLELVFVGVVRSADVDEKRVSMRLEPQNVKTMMAPRRFIGPESGFTKLMPAGTKITIGSTTYTLERR
jgi:hypothetical protein